MRKTLNFLGKGVAFIFFLVLLYFIIAVISSSIPVNNNLSAAKPDYTIYIENNGIHSDIVVPTRSSVFDWTQIADSKHTLSPIKNARFIAFGWGDLHFYKYTPQWDDLTPGIAFKALFLKSPAAMHVKFRNFIAPNEYTIAIELSEQQYVKLTKYIINSFDLDNNGRPQKIANLHYTQNDAFYKAKGSLNLFNTCNTWTNNALKSSGLKASLWTPFVEGIFYQYQ